MTGISGIGKSCSLERACSLYPQVIQHHWYSNQHFTWTQLVWFKLDCPSDGSVIGLCTSFFRQVDKILGTSYFQRYAVSKRTPLDKMVAYMATVVSNHSLGVLIIDEIQILKRAKDPRMLDFFVQLDNELGVPIVLVGTPDAENILSGDLRRARRASGQGDMRWGQMQNDVEWRYFLKSLWQYQYVHNPSDLNDELLQTMYYHSQGITDIAVKLYFLAQRYAIVTKEECITRETIHQAVNLGLNLIQPFLNYLRSNDTKKIKAYSNLPYQDIEAEFQQAENALTELAKAHSIPKATATKIKQHQAVELQEPQEDSRNEEKRKGETLPQIVAQGLKLQKIAAYQALKQVGYICNAVEYLVGEGDL